jgi:hypothetical protein
MQSKGQWIFVKILFILMMVFCTITLLIFAFSKEWVLMTVFFVIDGLLYIVIQRANNKINELIKIPIIKSATTILTNNQIPKISFSPQNTSIIPEPQHSIGGKETDFIFNPGAPFELRLLNADKEVFLKIRKILSDLTLNDYNKVPQIVGFFAEHNLKVKEVEDYKIKYRKVYFDKIEELKNNSNEWNSVGEKDKEDMLIDFRQIAMNEIYEKTKFDDYFLFEYEYKNLKIDNEIISEYGFENVETYLRYSDTLNKVRVLPNGNYNRPRFEKLVEVGLACRGNAIPLPEILSTLTLKDLNELAKNPAIEYKRKNLALDYLLNLPDIIERIGSKISLREFFKLNPIPEKYSSLNLKEISENLNYINIVVCLLIDTYRNSCFTIETLLDKEDVKGYTVSNYDPEKFMCPCAKKLINKNYPKSRPPKIPYHIGCTCSLEKIYDFD